jgi:hypothetical protein
MTIYNFTEREISPLSTYEKTDYYIIHEKLSNGEKLTKEEKVKAVFSSSSPAWKYMGYCYNCREFLNEYWIETEYYGIQKFWAVDITSIKKSGKLSGLGKIGKKIKVEN